MTKLSIGNRVKIIPTNDLGEIVDISTNEEFEKPYQVETIEREPVQAWYKAEDLISLEISPVKVPQVFADWLDEAQPDYLKNSEIGTKKALLLVTRVGWGYGLTTEESDRYTPQTHGEAYEWVKNNTETAVRAILDGFKVEKEKRFYLRANLPALFENDIYPTAYLSIDKSDYSKRYLGSKARSRHYDSIFTESYLEKHDIDETGFVREYLEED